MPESKKRKPKHPRRRSAAQKLARIDGTTFRIKSCCHVDVTVGVPRINVRHDKGCHTLTDRTPDGYQRRLALTMEIRERLEEHGIQSTVVISTEPTADAVLLVLR